MKPNFITKKPWWWFITCREWGTVAMTWGNNIYGSPEALRPDIIAHELHHIKQNKGKWYISLWFLVRSTFDDKFYQKLEFDARQAQLRFIYENSRNNGLRTTRKIPRKVSKRI